MRFRKARGWWGGQHHIQDSSRAPGGDGSGDPGREGMVGVQDVREEEVGEIRGPGRRGDRGWSPGRPGGGDRGGWDIKVFEKLWIINTTFAPEPLQTSSPRGLGVTILDRGRVDWGGVAMSRKLPLAPGSSRKLPAAGVGGPKESIPGAGLGRGGSPSPGVGPAQDQGGCAMGQDPGSRTRDQRGWGMGQDPGPRPEGRGKGQGMTTNTLTPLR